MILAAGSLNRVLRIERPVPDTSFDGAGSGTWELVEEVRASVQDVLPSRGEQLGDGLNTATGRARVRMRYRTDVTPDMRFLIEGRIVQIVSGPAVLGNRAGLELMVEDYRPAGNPA